MSTDLPSVSHLTNEELAAYIDRRLDVATSARIENHMAGCAECRGDLVDARSLLQSAGDLRVSSRLSWVRGSRVWLAAAGIVAIALLPLSQRALRPRAESAPTRAAQLSAANVKVVAPHDGSIQSAPVLFAWQSVIGASAFRLTVTDSSGRPVFTAVTSDTTVAPASDRQLSRGAYLWYVDCLTSDGRTLSSGIHSFSVSP